MFLRKSIYSVLFILCCCSYVAIARKHHLEVRNDMRPYIALSTFGFYTNGHLDVTLSKFTINDENLDDKFGLSLDKTTIDQMNPYLDSHQNKCILEEPSSKQHSGPILFFILNLKELKVHLQCSPEWENMHIYRELSKMYRPKRQSQIKITDSALFLQRRRRRRRDLQPLDQEAPVIDPTFEEGSVEINMPLDNKLSSPTLAKITPVPDKTDQQQQFKAPVVKTNNVLAKKESIPIAPGKPASAPADVPLTAISSFEKDTNLKQIPGPQMPVSSNYFDSNSHPQMQTEICKNHTLPMTKEVIDGITYYSFTFSMFVARLHDEGLYNLYFHACPNYRLTKMVSFNVDIEENNNGNYLSAGEMPLPSLYFMMSLLFFLSGLFWVFILKKSKHTVYKIHYIMTVLVFLKSLSLMFHSINYHFIEKRGEHVETWAILYYIAHLLKGAVLFITIVLIGTGWTFIKHILSDKDKKIFMIVIPLQILANVAQIITDESDQSDAKFRMWRNIFFFVDLLCCGAILFPIVWSIRHLHEASATDGKAAINLRKLKLFRQFYIMIVCYIYFTRIIVDLLQVAVVFQFAWLDEMFREMATYVFFVLTGYKFRPVSSHPYFTVPDEADDEVEVLTESGLTEGLHRTKPLNRNALHSTKTIVEGNDCERENLISKRESSHEYD